MSKEIPNTQIKLEDKLELLKDFPPPSFQEWKDQAEKDIKGASYEKQMLTKTYEEIILNPIYTKKEIENSPFIDSLPGADDFVRGHSPSGYLKKTWDVNQEIITEDAVDFNNSILEALGKGQNCINLTLDTATKLGLDADYADLSQVGDIGLSISAINSLKRALNNVDLSAIPIYIDTGFNNIPFLALLNSYCQSSNIQISDINGAITCDPIAHLSVYGELPVSLKYIFDMMKNSLDWKDKYAPKMKTISINTLSMINAGCNSVQELAISIAILVFYLNELTDRGADATNIVNSTYFKYGIGNNYFMEIAKFRAVRVLLSNIADAYNIKEKDLNLKIGAKSSIYTNTILDPYVNMLRSTTQTFSAILGGADSITTNPFDQAVRMSDSFSRRIARNTHTILREESHLDAVIDPAGGSYYIENLTEELAQRAWIFFKKIEDKGGIFKALSEGFIQSSINEISKLRNKDINKRISVIVGTNMYADIKEKQLETRRTDQIAFKKKRSQYLEKYRLNGTREKHEAILEILNSISGANVPNIINNCTEAYLIGSTIGEISSALNSSFKEKIEIEKLPQRRVSEDFEKLRNATVKYNLKYGSNPRVFLANFGLIKDYKARADFSKGFFEAGGFSVIDSQGTISINDLIKSSVESDSEIIVICSTDENYPKIVKQIIDGIKVTKPSTLIVLAGYPKEQIDEHKKAGVDDFIFFGDDVVAKLNNLLNKIRRD